MGTNPWMSRQDMIKFVSLIVKNGGYYRRTGDSTTFEVRKQVYGNTISLDMTVTPASVLVTGEIQPCMDRLFDEEDWDLERGFWNQRKASQTGSRFVPIV
mgnify:CR=1 FL=1